MRPCEFTGRVRAREAASVLIIVLWVSFGLVSLALYFAHSMSLEMRAADNRVAATEANQAIRGAVRYVTNLLATSDEPGQVPQTGTYRSDNVPMGDATFWLIGRGDSATSSDEPVFGIVDEASKLDLNTATVEMLEALPRMTPPLAAAIVDWRDTDDDASAGGAESSTYIGLNPGYQCKNAPFETVEELRLVYGMTLEILYGEDSNQNGILDPNENDGELSPPSDSRDGHLDPGLAEYLTVFTREPKVTNLGSNRVDLAAGNINGQQVRSTLENSLGSDRATAVMSQLGNLTNGFPCVLAFYSRSGMSADEFAQVEETLFVSTANGGGGLVNVNTASEAVLACIPGIGTDNAASLVARRRSNAANSHSLAWVTEVLDAAAQESCGPYITGRSYQFSVDIAALGHYGRGYRRVRYIVDIEGGAPRLIARRDLTPMGWGLGREIRRTLLLSQKTR